MVITPTSDIVDMLRIFRKCGFKLISTHETSENEVFYWSIKASALIHGYEWDGNNDGSDEISIILRYVESNKLSTVNTLELGNISYNTISIIDFAKKIFSLSLSMKNEMNLDKDVSTFLPETN